MIRLLEAKIDGTLGFREVEAGSSVPLYAILSHTWATKGEELSYSDVLHDTNRESSGYEKVKFCLQQAANDGMRYCWIDTCCIDKTNSVELNEAIISMFRWYQNAAKCYVYLSDVIEPSDSGWREALRKSRWFTRGWTLQELLAPRVVEFYSKSGEPIGDRTTLTSVIHEITNIPIEALQGREVSTFGRNERMSWAASRTTTREEDAAYCLLGIFKVTVLPAYGEGKDQAISRLRDAVRRTSRHTAAFSSDEDDLSDENLSDRAGPAKKRRIESNLKLSTEQTLSILNSLGFDEIETRRLTIKTAHTTTCKWLLHDPQYLAWLDTQKQEEHNGFLWIKGHPGCGKSTIMKWAFENARKQFRDHIRLAFFFNARGGKLEKSIGGAYRTVLVQLLYAVPKLRCVFQMLGPSAAMIGPGHEWEIDSLEMLLGEAIEQLGSTAVICFVDALDESDTDEIRRMLSFFESLCQRARSTSTRIRICLASRHYPHITIQKGIVLSLDDKEGHRQDIADYLSTELRIGNDELSDRIRAELLAKAQGSFIWVVLVVVILNKEYDQGRRYALQKRLAEIPADIYKLFRNVLTRGSGEAEPMTEIGLCVQWILYSAQPLTSRELCAAILCDVEGQTPSGIEAMVMSQGEHIKRYVLHVSKGLAETIKSGRRATIQFIHETVKDFFLKKNGFREIWPELGENFEGQSHRRLQRSCLAFLNIDQKHTRGDVIRNQPFFCYAVENVLYHADQAARSGIAPDELLHGFPLDQWIRCARLLEQYPARMYTEGVSVEYLFADRNLPNLIKGLKRPLQYLKETDERYGTPLFAALAKGHDLVARVMLETTATELGAAPDLKRLCLDVFSGPNWRGKFRNDFEYTKTSTVLEAIAEHASTELANLLIELHPEILKTSNDIGEALQSAARNGNHRLIAGLFDSGRERNAVAGNTKRRLIDGFNFMGALAYATEHGHVKTLRVLLNQENELDAVTEWHVQRWETCVKSAVDATFHECVSALFSSAAYVKYPSRRHALFIYVVKSGSLALLKLLVRHGADVNLMDEAGQTALYTACKMQSPEVARLLMREGADPNIAGDHESLPIRWLCCDAFPKGKLLPTLVEHGASLLARGPNGEDLLEAGEKRHILAIAFDVCEAAAARRLLHEIVDIMTIELLRGLLVLCCRGEHIDNLAYLLDLGIAQAFEMPKRFTIRQVARDIEQELYYLDWDGREKAATRRILDVLSQRGLLPDLLRIADRLGHDDLYLLIEPLS